MSENAQDQDLAGRRIVLGVTGGIAAYKSCTLCRLLKAAGAQQFVSAATFAALSGQAVGTDMFSHPERIPHLATMAGANLMVIAPATANTLARLRAGLADDLLSACALGANCPIVVAPAMNSAMYHHPATQENLKIGRASCRERV